MPALTLFTAYCAAINRYIHRTLRDVSFLSCPWGFLPFPIAPYDHGHVVCVSLSKTRSCRSVLVATVLGYLPTSKTLCSYSPAVGYESSGFLGQVWVCRGAGGFG